MRCRKDPRLAVNLIALETSTEYCSLAVSEGTRVFARNVHAGQRHSEMALPALGELLCEAGLEMADVQGVVYGAGPGSFTGLRIACGVAQGLALAHNLPVLGISTLLALAENCDSEQVIACLDARMGEVYHAVYRKRAADWMEMHAPGVYAPAAVPLVEGGGWVGCGSGFAAHGDALQLRLGGAIARVDAQALPDAAAMLRLAAPRFAHGEGGDAADAVPLYVRDKVALKASER